MGRNIPGDNAEYDYRIFMEEQAKKRKPLTSLEMLAKADEILKGDKEIVSAAGHAQPPRSLD